MYSILGSKTLQRNLRPHECLAFEKIAKFYKTDVTLIPTSSNSTPDLKIPGLGIWEIKSPKGNSKNTIENNFKEAKGQSANIIIDLSRTKFRSDVAIRKILAYNKKSHKHIKNIKVLKKNGEIIDIL